MRYIVSDFCISFKTWFYNSVDTEILWFLVCQINIWTANYDREAAVILTNE